MAAGIAVNSHKQIVFVTIYLIYAKNTLTAKSKLPDSNIESKYTESTSMSGFSPKNGLFLYLMFLGIFM